MKKDILKISIRHNAVFLDMSFHAGASFSLSQTTTALVVNAARLGFAFSEELLHAINSLDAAEQAEVLEVLEEVSGKAKNWTPLVKEWHNPTGESVLDHIVTFLANVFDTKQGCLLACGHWIPEHTFPLERYNGCPFCGTPFESFEIEKYGQGSKHKVLYLWDKQDLKNALNDLLQSKTPLDATQADSLRILLKHMPFDPEITIAMKETQVLVIDELIDQEREGECAGIFKGPNDILRYLWYKHTGFLQIVEPKTIIEQTRRNHRHINMGRDQSAVAAINKVGDLKLKYSRKECRRVAYWLNSLDLDAEQACEIMHAKRNMWVRFIRALRLAEYSKRKGFEKLNRLMDVFYNQSYSVWQGRVDHYKRVGDPVNTFRLLKQKPGVFSRLLFSSMLCFGEKETLRHFYEVMDRLPARLLFTLNTHAANYFDKDRDRIVKPLGGNHLRIPPHYLLGQYSKERLRKMQSEIEVLALEAMRRRFAGQTNQNKTIFIDDQLFNLIGV